MQKSESRTVLPPRRVLCGFFQKEIIMTPTAHNRPLKIVHDLPYPKDADINAKCRAATDYLHMLLDRGFGGIVTNVSTHNDYLKNEEEWRVFSHLAAECERLDLRLWVYDEKGYPSGAAGTLTIDENPDFEATGVVMVTQTVAPQDTVTIPLPHGHMHFLYAALYPLRGEDESAAAPVDVHLGIAPAPADLSPLATDKNGRYSPVAVADCDHSPEAVTLRNPTDGPVLACAFVQKRLYEGTHCVHNVFECRRYIDVTNPDAVAAFLRNTYDQYAAHLPDRFGGGTGNVAVPTGQIEAFFTDEPSLMGCYINAGLYPRTVRHPYDETIPLYPVLSWGRDVADEFQDYYGYDLLPELVSVFLGDTAHAKKVRCDFYRLLSDLYEYAFFSQISDWCAAHNTNFSGHILLEDTIKYHTIFEGNFFSLLRRMHYPGIDMLQSIPSVVRDYAFTPKLVSSVARAYGRPHVMSEVSAHAQGGNVTHDQMYASLCAQYALGVDVFTYYYSENFMDPETYTRYNTALARIGAIMQGQTVTDCLLYYPIETFRMHHRPSAAQYGTYTAAENLCERELNTVMNFLLDHQIDFDFIDAENLVMKTENEDGRLLDYNGHRCELLLFPPMEYTDDLIGTIRDMEHSTPILELFEVAKAETVLGGYSPETLANALSTYFSHRAVIAEKPTHGLLRLLRDTDRGRALLLCNTGEHEVTTTLTVKGMTAPVLYDPMTDSTLPCAPSAIKPAENAATVTVTLPALATYILREETAI